MKGQQGNQVLKPRVWAWLGGEGLSRDLQNGSKVTCQGTIRRLEHSMCIYLDFPEKLSVQLQEMEWAGDEAE